MRDTQKTQVQQPKGVGAVPPRPGKLQAFEAEDRGTEQALRNNQEGAYAFLQNIPCSDSAEEHQRQNEREVLYQLAHNLARAPDVRAIADHLFHQAKSLLQADFGWLMLANAAGTELTGVAAFGPDAETFPQQRIALRTESAPAALAFQRQQLVVVGDVANSPLVSQRLREAYHFVKSAWIVPLMKGDVAAGAFMVGYATHREAMAEELQLVKLLGDEAALALDRARITEELRESEERYRALIENAKDAIYTHDLAGNFTSINKAAEQLSGYTRDEALTMNIAQVVVPEHLELARQTTARQLAGETPPAYELDILTKDGRRVPLELNTCLILHKGQPVGIQGIARDISERKSAEEALRESERRFQRITRATNDALWDWDLRTNALWWNQGIHTLFGYAAEEIGSDITWWFEHIHPEDRERVTASVRACLNSDRQMWREEYRYRRADGSYAQVFDRGYVERDAGGKPVRAFGGMVDVSARKQIEEERHHLQLQLLQSQKLEAMGTLAGGIAHDFNNLLSVILGFTELTTDEVPQESIARQNLEQVIKASLRAKAVVRQLLAFSRSAAAERQRIALGPLVEETLVFLRASLPPQVQLDSCIRHEVGEVLADPTQLQQVVMNLCINGAQAMGEKGGLLEVSLHSVELETPLATDSCTLDPGAYILLTVRDAGCGMTPEVKQRIFEPFFTTKEIGAGSGLGLAVVHGIIRSHGGAILVESQPGKGSMLQVFLPRDRHEIRTVIAEDRYWDADLVQANGEKGGPRSGTYSSH